jgi:putative ABC transport system substrate-binding protein
MAMRRREFIAALGGAASWPLVARAQERVRRVGVLIANPEGDPEGQTRAVTFRQDLQKLGWIEGRNIQIDFRWGAGEPTRAQAYAADLVALAPDVILAHGTPASTAVKQATGTIPIVFVVVVDPVGAGLVQSLARPGGNVTGFGTFEPAIGGKWLELLKEISPDLKRVACILDPAFSGFASIWDAIESLAPKLELQVTTVIFRAPSDDVEAGVATFARDGDGGLIVLPTTINNIARKRIFSLAARHRLPAVYPFRVYTTEGGLMFYGFDSLDLFRRGAAYVDRILKGEKPNDLPVQTPTKYELVVNLKTANELGLTIPPALLARADEVIE